jgi:hypothetical protein
LEQEFSTKAIREKAPQFWRQSCRKKDETLQRTRIYHMSNRLSVQQGDQKVGSQRIRDDIVVETREILGITTKCPF